MRALVIWALLFSVWSSQVFADFGDQYVQVGPQVAPYIPPATILTRSPPPAGLELPDPPRARPLPADEETKDLLKRLEKEESDRLSKERTLTSSPTKYYFPNPFPYGPPMPGVIYSDLVAVTESPKLLLDTISTEGSGSEDFTTAEQTTVTSPPPTTTTPCRHCRSSEVSFNVESPLISGSSESSDSEDEKVGTNDHPKGLLSQKSSSPLTPLIDLLGMVSNMKKKFMERAEEDISSPSSTSNLESIPMLGPINSVLDGINVRVKEDGKDEVNPMENVKKFVKDLLSNIADAKTKLTETIIPQYVPPSSYTEESKSSSVLLEDAKKPSRGVGSFLSLLNANRKTEAAGFGLLGPHICVKEMNKKHKKDNQTISLEKECEVFPQSVRCVQKRNIAEGWLETTRIQECCEGFTTDDITKRGCDIELIPETFDSIISKYNLSDAPRDLVTSTIMFSKNSSKEVTVFPFRLMDYDLIDGVILSSVDGKKFIVSHDKEEKTTHMNCVLLNKTNIFLENGMAIISDEEVSPATMTVMDKLETDGRFKTFLSILSPKMKETLNSSSTSVNVFPFTDASVENFSEEIQKQLKSNKSCVSKAIEKHHIFEKAVCAHKLPSSESPAEIVKTSSGTLFIGGAKIVETDGVALNGMIHVVDEVIKKEEVESWMYKLKEIVPNSPVLLNQEIVDKEPLIILVPTTSKLQNVEDALNHLIPLQISSLDQYPPSITTMDNSTIFVGKFRPMKHGFIYRSRKSSAPLQFGCSRVISHPKVHKNLLSACGASIIFLDKPLPKVNFTMEEFLASRPDVSRFASFYNIYSSTHTLYDVSTLFIPVDDAFAVNSFKKLKNDQKAITNLVRTHMISRPICEHDIEACTTEVRSKIMNENGKSLPVGGEEGERTIGNSKILETVIVSDGIVHLIEDIISTEVSLKKEKSSLGDAFSTLEGRLLGVRDFA